VKRHPYRQFPTSNTYRHSETEDLSGLPLFSTFALAASFTGFSLELRNSRPRNRNAPEIDQTEKPIANQCPQVQALLPLLRPISASQANSGIAASNAHQISRSFLIIDSI
jgi:hypothetical protein